LNSSREYKIHINPSSPTPKFQQLIDVFINAINRGKIPEGSALPSVNKLIFETRLSRDTIVKAYNELKKRGIIEAIPNKGYYVKNSRTRIFLFLDTYSPFKEGLYNAFRNELPEEYEIDLVFHHHNPRVFESLLINSVGKYSVYLIMCIDNPQVISNIEKLNPSRVLILDLKYYVDERYSNITQNFDQAFHSSLEQGKDHFRKYNSIFFIRPPASNHPGISEEAFMSFCKTNQFDGHIRHELRDSDMEKGNAYIVVSDSDLVRIIEFARSRGYEPGRDIGLVSCNDTPVKKIIENGITVISTDFAEMGRRAASFVKSREYVSEEIPTKLILRGSL
jgi:DNA-binding transcriptional regulator YhcF (GntR family)